MSIHRAWIFAYRELKTVFKADYVGLGYVNHGTDDGEPGPVKT